MKTIGEVLRTARIKKKLSLSKVEEETKIKKNFIKAIEEGSWDKLPDVAVISGFVKSISSYLGIEESKAMAILKRDYLPKKENYLPKKDVSREFTWSPRYTFYLGGGIILALVFSYLIFQYLKFVRPPSLSLQEPADKITINGTWVTVKGRTDTSATIFANNQPLIVDENGYFKGELEVLPGEQEIIVAANSRAGKKTVISRKIIVVVPD